MCSYIDREGEALNTLLKQIKPRQMTLPGVTPGGWSVKDILAHVVGWQTAFGIVAHTEVPFGSPPSKHDRQK